MDECIVTSSIDEVGGREITYENLPVYHDPYGSGFYKPLYGDDFQFENLTIKFSVSSSANYEKAVFICRRLPGYKLGDGVDGPHSFTIDTYTDFFTYKKAIDCLVYLIYNWKSTCIFINGELVRDSFFTDMSWVLTQRLNHCPVPLPPLAIYDVAQEYWDTYKKLLILPPKRRRKKK